MRALALLIPPFLVMTCDGGRQPPNAGWDGLPQVDTIAVFDPEGRFVTSFGGKGEAPDHFRWTLALARLGDGRIAVKDGMGGDVALFPAKSDFLRRIPGDARIALTLRMEALGGSSWLTYGCPSRTFCRWLRSPVPRGRATRSAAGARVRQRPSGGGTGRRFGRQHLGPAGNGLPPDLRRIQPRGREAAGGGGHRSSRQLLSAVPCGTGRYDRLGPVPRGLSEGLQV